MDSGLLAALGPGMTAVVTCAAAHYIVRAGLRCLLDTYSRGLTIPKGAVPGRARGSGHMAPTYFCRFPGSKSDGSCGSALLPLSSSAKADDPVNTDEDRMAEPPRIARLASIGCPPSRA